MYIILTSLSIKGIQKDLSRQWDRTDEVASLFSKKLKKVTLKSTVFFNLYTRTTDLLIGPKYHSLRVKIVEVKREIL